MSILLNPNQFAQTAVLGMLTNDPQPNTIPVRLNPAGSGPYRAGTPLKLIASSSPETIVDIANGTTDAVYGVIPFNPRKNVYVAGDLCQLAGKGNYIYLESTAAINRGALVKAGNASATGGGPGVTSTAVAADQVIGTAMSQAGGAAVLVRVYIDPAKIPA